MNKRTIEIIIFLIALIGTIIIIIFGIKSNTKDEKKDKPNIIEGNVAIKETIKKINEINKAFDNVDGNDYFENLDGRYCVKYNGNADKLVNKINKLYIYPNYTSTFFENVKDDNGNKKMYICKDSASQEIKQINEDNVLIDKMSDDEYSVEYEGMKFIIYKKNNDYKLYFPILPSK